MFELSVAESVGYAASLLVVLSLTMTSVVRLRSISLVGSITFVAYGLMIGSMPILITNVSIAGINLWFLRSELGMRRDLGASPIDPDAPFLTDFIEFHLPDIRRFQPEFSMPGEDAWALLLLRDGLPAGAILGRRNDQELEVVMDYVVQAYRDSRLGEWLYGRGADVFRQAGIKRIITVPGNELHRAYLRRVGFDFADGRFCLDLN